MNDKSKSLFPGRWARILVAGGVLAAVLILYFSIGTRPPSGEDISGTIGLRPGAGVAETVQDYLSSHLYQEAAWQCLEIGDRAMAVQILDTLRQIMHSRPVSVRKFGKPINVSETFLVRFRKGVKGIFKVEKSDSLGPVKREAAAYKLDELLGFNLTPLTIMRGIELPDGTLERGSLMYFVKNCKPAMEVGSEKTDKLRLFDAIIGNSDRHENNWLVRETGDIVAIDHNRTFRHDNTGFAVTYWHQEIQKIANPRKLGPVYERFKKIPARKFEESLRDVLEPDRLELFLSTRKEIIKRIEKRKHKKHS
ncbi:MAG: hypothetical protein ACE5IY_05685 [bacterium]